VGKLVRAVGGGGAGAGAKNCLSAIFVRIVIVVFCSNCLVLGLLLN
jgi:hypothetical protein